MKINKSISRRQFLGLAGGVAGITLLTSMGLNSGFEGANTKLMKSDFETKNYYSDVLVIGSGMAGLFAAVKAYDSGAKIIIVSKGRLGSSGQTPFAKGIFEYDPATAKYSLDEFTKAVGRSALGTNNPVYTRQMAEHSKARVDELRKWGFFNSTLYNKSFSKPINERNIPLIERVTITHLIKEKNRIVGAAGFSIDEKKTYFFHARSIILCTGAGGFKPNGFPICDLTHDGTVMAYDIGAKVTGKEWNDGHSGRAINPAACYDGWGDMFERKPFTTGIEIHHDLGVDANYMAYINGPPVEMGPGLEKVNNGGPYIPDEFKRDMEKQGPPPHGGKDRPSPLGGKNGPKGGGPPGMGGGIVGGASAGMAIHKSEGLVPINDKCESNIPGLYAAGDALGSYMAGAIYTQVGSSLAGSAVQGAIAGEAAAQYSKTIKSVNISVSRMVQIEKEIYAPLERKAGYNPEWITQTLQGIMIPNFVLYIKKENLMEAALIYIEELRDHHIPMMRASDLHELRLAHETRNMVISSEMKLRASLMRTESRCSHYRLDYPEPDFKNWQAWINIYKGKDGTMMLEKQPFSEWS